MAQKTLVLIKPDAFRRNLVSKIMGRIEKKGFNIIDIQLWDQPPREFVENHYCQDRYQPYFGKNCDFMTSGPILSIVYDGENVISAIRSIQGKRDIPGTIRGDYVNDVRQNLIHASDSEESAEKEINIWFPGRY